MKEVWKDFFLNYCIWSTFVGIAAGLGVWLKTGLSFLYCMFTALILSFLTYGMLFGIVGVLIVVIFRIDDFFEKRRKKLE